MHVLVTGGAGFIGSHVVQALVGRGDAVTVLDVFDDAYDPVRKERNLRGVDARVVRGDVTVAADVREALGDAEVVVHLAARPGVRESADFERINAGGTAVVVDALEGRRLVFASSSSVYGARADGPFREDDPVAPVSPYAASKCVAEAHAGRARDVTIVRPFTVYGPRQRPGMAVSRFVRAALSGSPAPLLGDGSIARDFTYVGDIVAAIVAAVDRPGQGVVNVGAGNPVRLDALIDAVGRAVGRPVPIERRPAAAADVPLTWADRSRAARVLGWEPAVSLDEGLARTVAWFRAGEP